MKSIMNILEKYFVPFAGRVGGQRHLVAIRDGFVALMPILIAGSFAVLINNLPVEAYQSFMTNIFGDGWKAFGGNIWWGAFAIISLFLVFSIAYNLSKSYGKDGLAAGMIALASFFILIPQVSPNGSWGDIHWSYVNSGAMFVAIIVAMLTTELFVKLSGNKRLLIRMPEGVPPAVAKSFESLLPGLIVLVVVSFLSIFISKIPDGNLFVFINRVVAAPLRNVADSLGSAVLIVFMNQILWFFGLHGSNIIGGIIEPVLLPLIEANMAAVNAGLEPAHIVTKVMLDTFVYMGGSGATIGLIVATIIGAKRAEHREIAKLGAAPGLFNINEPVMFGYPIVLNPFMLIPFLLGPILMVIFTYFTMKIGFCPKTVAIVPWTFPPVIGAMVATASIRGGLVALINLLISIVIYFPFILALEKDKNQKEEAK